MRHINHLHRGKQWVALTATCALAFASGGVLVSTQAVPSADAEDISTKSLYRSMRNGNVFSTVKTVDHREYYVAPQNNVSGTSKAANTNGSKETIHLRSDEQLPWDLSLSYTLDGPSVKPSAIQNATGTIGIHVKASPNPHASQYMRDYAKELRTFVVFSIPAEVCEELSVSQNVTIAEQGRDHVLIATANAGETLEFDVYGDMQHFRMSPVSLVAMSADSAHAYSQGVTQIADQSTHLVDSITHDSDTSNTGHEELIKTLTKLKDQELALAKSSIAEKKKAHEAAFHEYMSAYVDSYTTHMGSPIGSKTQLTALMGTAGELKGDTRLAHAVTGLATAVNDLSDAYQHTGAAQEVENIIQRIQQEGTSGLADDLKQTAGEEMREGQKGYSAGQSQLSKAMIPYSMAYTDAYTKVLSTLANDDLGLAKRFQEQAIAQTNSMNDSDPGLHSNQQGVDAAMASLAAAREHTGAASAAQQVLLRFSDQFGVTDSASKDSGGKQPQPLNAMQPGMQDNPIAKAAYEQWYQDSIGGKAELKLSGQINTLRKKERAERTRGSKNGDMSTLVSATQSDASADVAKYAGSVAKDIKTTSEKTGRKDAQDTQEHSSGTPASERLLTEFAFSGRQKTYNELRPTNRMLIDQTVQIASAQSNLQALASALENKTPLQAQIMPGERVRLGENEMVGTRFMILSSAE